MPRGCVSIVKQIQHHHVVTVKTKQTTMMIDVIRDGLATIWVCHCHGTQHTEDIVANELDLIKSDQQQGFFILLIINLEL